MPKFNLYQSLHTTVIGPGGKVVEVQIRTREMHQRAEWGVAAHWAYKDDVPSNDIDWLNRIIDWQAEITDPAAFMENLKTDLEQDEVFVFTPKGRVITLPVGSTTVDFAYAVHTEVGHRCIGAKVNGRLVPLQHKLRSGDTCEIFTSKVESAGPSRDWLQFVESPRARNKIRQWFSRERRVDMIEAGRDELTKEFRREGLPLQRIWASELLARRSQAASYADLDALLAAIGEHHVSARSRRPEGGPRLPHRRRRRAAAVPPSTGQSSARTPAQHRRRARRGARRRARAAVAAAARRCRATTSSASSPAVVASACTAPTAPTPSVADERAGDPDDRRRVGRRPAARRCSAPASRWSRSTARELLRDVANALSEQHVNIVAVQHRTPAATASPRCASSSRWPTPATSTPCCARSRRSTPSTTPTGWSRRRHPARPYHRFARSPSQLCDDRTTAEGSASDEADATGTRRSADDEPAVGSLRSCLDIPDQPRDARHPGAGVGALAALRRGVRRGRRGGRLRPDHPADDARTSGVFQRVGDATDIVTKEMYDFVDKGGRHVALRPELTASVCRAFVEHRPPTPWKVWYAGPNFRYESPQRGRYRQFDQVGIEVLGADDPLPRRRGDRPRLAVLPRARTAPGEAAAQLARRARRSGPLRRRAAAYFEARRRCAVAESREYARQEPAACARLQATRGRADHRRRATIDEF